jgi:hypothetical protein
MEAINKIILSFKICSGCGQAKLREEFIAYRRYCRVCWNKRQIDLRLKREEKKQENDFGLRENNPIINVLRDIINYPY